MINKYISFIKNNGVSPYIWVILCILPFYFIFQSDISIDVKVIGVILTLLFLIIYQAALLSGGWPVYVWTVLLIGGSFTATILFGYIYFVFFLAYLVGNFRHKVAFYIFYFFLLISTTVSVNIAFIQQDRFFLIQLPFVIITCISVILMPFTIRNRKEMGHLEEQLLDANRKISDLLILEERERIARDLHDTLGQKLSLIGLKSDLARRLILKDPEQAGNEMQDIQQTARTALNEVRKMVSSMRGIRLKDEIVLVQQMLEAAQIHFEFDGLPKLSNAALLTENILSMCLKEAVTNVVKHSGAKKCKVSITQDPYEIEMIIHDDGKFTEKESCFLRGHGLIGMKERLEFVNGSLSIDTTDGTAIRVKVPNDVKQSEKGGD